MRNIYKYEQKHPSDTHPSLLERMNNLKVNKSEITNIALFNFTPSSISLIDNAEIIEENLTKYLIWFINIQINEINYYYEKTLYLSHSIFIIFCKIHSEIINFKNCKMIKSK